MYTPVYACIRVYTAAMNPPKCKACGAVEWGHVCGPNPKIMALVEKRIEEVINSPEMKRARKAITDSVMNEGTGGIGGLALLVTSKPDRKEYLKLKARERRARVAAAKKAGK